MPVKAGGPERAIEPLASQHDRAAFSCSSRPGFENYVKRLAGQDAKHRLAAPFVLCEDGSVAVIGFYTLSSCSLHLPDLSPERARKDRLPPGRIIPATLLGQLAVADGQRGKGLGEYLLVDALHRAWRHSSEIASYAVVVDAIDQAAADFYRHFDFFPMPSIENRLYLPMGTIARLF
jgi:GNAT superfamily N-acetyltransferase